MNYTITYEQGDCLYESTLSDIRCIKIDNNCMLFFRKGDNLPIAIYPVKRIIKVKI